MLRLFGHHVSVRAVTLAALELLIFVAIYNISRVFMFSSVSGAAYESADQSYLFPLFCLIAFGTASACGLYNKDMCERPNRALPRLVVVSVLMYGLMALIISMAEAIVPGAEHISFYYAITLSSVAGYFIAASLFRHNGFDFGRGARLLERRILVVGVDECAAKVEYMNGTSISPYKTVGFIPVGQENRSKKIGAYKILPEEILHSQTGLLDQARKLHADEIVVASRERRGLPTEALMECKLAGLVVTEFASFWERQTGQIDLEELTPGWIIFSDGFQPSRLLIFSKRALDILVSSIVLVCTLPLMIGAAIAIKCEGPGPLLYRQERVGKGGVSFKIFKFRSMRTDAEKDGVARWAQSNDDRITRVGRFLRRTRIDEIPQIINVFLGQMSFVGPRPERPVFVEALAQKIPLYDVRHRIKPGITGWAQINYPYGASDADARAKLSYDLYYAKNWGLFLDVVILAQTARVVMWPEGVR